MKKSDKLRVKTRKMIAKNLIILVALAVVAFVGAYSWFTNHTEADAQGIQITSTMPYGLEYFIVAPNDTNSTAEGYAAINTWISTYNTNHASDTGFVAKGWHEGTLTIDYSDAEFGFLSDLFLCETTSNGKVFKIPKLEQYGEIAYVVENEAFDDATPNDEYMSFDLYFRSKQQLDVKLLYSSSITPAGTPGIGSDEAMKNAAIGAVRMSVYNGSVRELLWIPGPRVWFDGTTNNGDGTLYTSYTGSTAGTYSPGGNVYYDNGYALRSERTIDHAYYTQSGSGSNLTTTREIEQNGSNNVVASTGTGSNEYKLGTSSADNISVCTLDSSNYDSTTGYYYNRVRINLWIEGEDAESRLKFVGGNFSLNMQYDVVEINS